MKSTKVVVLETSDGTLLSIPFNSSILFSVLYNPNDNLKEAKKVSTETLDSMLVNFHDLCDHSEPPSVWISHTALRQQSACNGFPIEDLVFISGRSAGFSSVLS